MQLLESSPLGLRAARIGMVSQTSPVKITLFPMVHIGEPVFFEAVYADAFAHDTVLVEGVKSPIVRRITRSYRWIEGAKHLALKVQPPHPRASETEARIVHADLSETEFAQVWREVPVWLRAIVYIGAPIVGLWYRWFGTREALAHGLSFEDLPRREETLGWNAETAALTTAIVDARDRHLVSVLRGELARIGHLPSRLAIVYGAHHMRGVLRELSRQGYHAAESDWLLVFSPSPA